MLDPPENVDIQPAAILADLEVPKIEPIKSTSGLHSIKATGSTPVNPLAELEVAAAGEPSIELEETGEEEEEGTDDAGSNSVEAPSTEPTTGVEGSAVLESGSLEKDMADELEEAEDGDGSESEESSDDDEEEEEEEEPTLKYARLGGGTVEILAKDSASALAVSKKFIALGTHNGAIFILDFEGKIIKKFKPHSAMINDLSIDTGSEFVASASMDGRVSFQSLNTSETYVFDLQRPMRCVALEPNFGKRTTRQFVSGGMAGTLVLHEKGWLGHKETTLHSGEGPIWAVEWKGTLIAWANDAGVRIYDTASSQRITFISRAQDSPRADLFKCTLHWQNDRTLLIAWADFIKVAVIKDREGKRGQLGVGIPVTELYVEVSSIFQVDCMISGIAPYRDSYLILAYLTEDMFNNEATIDPAEQRRKAGSRPELRIISKDGEELSSDAISLRNYDRFQCRDYSLCPAPTGDSFYVISPQDIVLAEPRDEADHITWLIEQKQYEPALLALEKSGLTRVDGFDLVAVGKKYLEHLIHNGEFIPSFLKSCVDVFSVGVGPIGEYAKAASSCPKILGINAKLWEEWVFLFAGKGHLQEIIPFVPTHDPQLSRSVYEMILSHFLRNDRDALLRTIKTWSHDIYDVNAIVLAIQAQLERDPKSVVLMESIAELFVLNRQPGKALPYFLKLRRPGVFDLIRENNLFTDVQDQALLLIEFDLDVNKDRVEREITEDSWVNAGPDAPPPAPHGTAISLLVDHTHSIPIPRVVAQLQSHRQFLFMYLDALFLKDPHLAFDYSDLQVDLYAEYDANKLMDFLRSSSYYSLERAYSICDSRDLVPEMVFLLGRMGDNKRALNLIIERLGDVQRAIEFAKEQNDNDLWEDLLRYSETKPRFIRGLLENVGAEIDPIRLIRRIKNGLEIPGLKLALIKILQDFNLQISLMEGCKTILYSDCRQLALKLHDGQTNGFLFSGETQCRASGHPIFPQLNGAPFPSTLPFAVRTTTIICNLLPNTDPLSKYDKVHFLCGDTFDAAHAFPSSSPLDSSDSLPAAIRSQRDNLLVASLVDMSQGKHSDSATSAKAMSSKLKRANDFRGAGCTQCGKSSLGVVG